MDSTRQQDTGPTRRPLAERLQNLHRRVIYGVLFVVTVGAFMLPPLPVAHVSPEVRAAFQAIESCPPDKVIIFDSSWAMWTQAENRAQFLALVEHMFRRDIKFVVTSVGLEQFGPKLAQDELDKLAEKHDKEYGVDYVNLGYKSAGGSAVVGAPLGFLMDAFARDIHAIFPTDREGTPVSELPLMQRVKNIEDAHLVVCVAYEPPVEWISFVHAQFGTPLVFACMSITVPRYAIYFEAEQVAGILGGTRGAAEYERLLELEEPGEGTQLMTPQSFVHILMIVFIILGNIGYLSTLRRKR
jgi:hypothetical protein